MKYDHNPFENQIFDHFRKERKHISSAIQLLIRHGLAYKKGSVLIIDLQNTPYEKELSSDT